METETQQSDNPTPPVTAEASTSTPTILSSLEDSTEAPTILETLGQEQLVESIKDRLRTLWQSGSGWRLEFGRELREYRKVTEHGDWIKFLESEFGLHRQTAYNWMRKAAEADGVSLDEPQNNNDEPDTHAEEVAGLIAEEQAKVKEAEEIQLNGPKPIRLILDAATEDEKDLYKTELKRNRDWVQSTLRAAFDTILAGKPVVEVRKKLELLPDDEPTPVIEDSDLPDSFFEDDDDSIGPLDLTDEEAVACYPEAYEAGRRAGETAAELVNQVAETLGAAAYYNPENVN